MQNETIMLPIEETNKWNSFFETRISLENIFDELFIKTMWQKIKMRCVLSTKLSIPNIANWRYSLNEHKDSYNIRTEEAWTS